LIGVLEGVLVLVLSIVEIEEPGGGDAATLAFEARLERRVEFISDSGMMTEAEGPVDFDVERLLLIVPLFLEIDLLGVVVEAATLELFSF
jgi:hypothetical protein